MALQFDGSGSVELQSGGFTLSQNAVWTWVLEDVEYVANGEMIAGNSAASGPYVGWFNGNFEIRFGATIGVSGSYVVGQKYRITISCDGAANVTVDVDGVGSSTGIQNTAINIDIFGKYSNGLNFNGEIGQRFIITGANEGDLTYNFEQAQGSTVLVEEVQGISGDLVNFTTGGFGVPATIEDTTPPVITLAGDNPLSLVQGNAYVEPGYTATDDTDGDITANVTVGGDTVDENTIGTYNITYDVSDAAGNPATQVIRVVNVVAADTTPPVITLIGDNPLSLTEGTAYVEPGYTATDDVDGDLTPGVIVGGDTVDENTIGTYVITYDVSDTSGNAATQVTRTVNVVAAPSETITITSIVEGETRKRDENGQATFTIAGDITGATGPVEYRLDDGAWQTLDAGTGTSFSGDVVVTNQQDVEVRLASNNAVTDIVRYVTAALIIVEGPSQSNGAGRGDNLQTPVFDTNQPLPTMWKNGIGFSLLEDPTSNESTPVIKGSMWPHIAKKYADLGIPVCIGNVAVGGTTVGGAWSTVGQNYQKIDLFAAACGGLSLITTLIGESDTSFGTTKEEYKTRYLEAVTQLNADYGADVYATYFPVGNTLSGNANLQNIRDAISELIAENEFIKFGGDLATVDITGQPDGLHIIYDEDIEEAAQIRFNAFQGIASSVTIDFAGAPDGTFDFIYWDASSIDLSAPLGVETVTITNEQFTINTTLQPGSEIVGFIPGDTPPTTGGAVYGVTV